MATLQEIRQQYPQYKDMPDNVLADKLYQKFYSDIPREQFDAKLGLKSEPVFKGSVGADVGQGAASGFMRGGLDLLQTIVNPAGSFMAGPGLENTVEDITGREFYDPQTKLGKVAETAGSFVPFTMAGGPAGTAGKLIKSGLAGAGAGATSEIAGQAAEGTPYEIPARLLGGMGPSLLRPSTIKTAIKGEKVVPPTSEELIKTGGQTFEDIRKLNVHYKADAVKNVALKLQSDLYKAGIYQEAAPDTWRILDKLIKTPAAGLKPTITIDALTTVRQQLRTAANKGKSPTSATPAEAAAAPRVRRALDDFVESPPPQAVVSGPADVAAKLTKTARADYAAGKQSQRLENLEESAELRAAVTYSGQNAENNIRRKAADIVDPLKPKNREGFNKLDLELIEKVARGSKSANLLRYVGNLLGGGGGLGAGTAAAIVGSAVGTVTGIAPGIAAGLATPAIGAGLKTLATRSTQKAFRKADEAVRSRAPLSQQKAQGALPTRSILNRAAPAIPIGLDVLRDKNGIPILDQNGQPIPLR